MQSERSHDIQRLMTRFRAGDRQAAGELVSCLYPELHRIAAARMHQERQEHTWCPTILVNELYLELVKVRALRPAEADESERDAFLRLSGFLMRRLLMQHARPLSKKAGRLSLDECEPELDPEENGLESLLQIDAMLNRLATIDSRLRTVVEMRIFEGRSLEEIAAALGCSLRTASTHWNFAKRWLQTQLDPQGNPMSAA